MCGKKEMNKSGRRKENLGGRVWPFRLRPKQLKIYLKNHAPSFAPKFYKQHI